MSASDTPLEPFRTLTAPTLVLPGDDVDTDQIIPARFLTTTTREGLGDHAFADQRASDPDHPLNQPHARERAILVAGDNFGCGSSREHAPWALVDFGFRAVLAPSFADIFSANALKSGLLPVVVPPEAHAVLMARPGQPVTIDLNACTVQIGNEAPISFQVEAFARRCLLDGRDPLGFILDHDAEISAWEARA